MSGGLSTSSSKALKYLAEQEDLEDPPSLRPPSPVNKREQNTTTSSSSLSSKKSLFAFPSLKFTSIQKKNNNESTSDSTLYSFSDISKTNNSNNNSSTAKLSVTNLDDLNSSHRSLKKTGSASGSGRLLSSVSHTRGGGGSVGGDGNNSDDIEKQSKISQIFATHFTYSKGDIASLISSSSGGISSSNKSGATSSHQKPLSFKSLTKDINHDNDNSYLAMEEGMSSGGNQNPIIQSLKSALKTVLSEMDTLEAKCVAVEDRYKDSIVQASVELQQSMNILFQLQQKSQKLIESRNKIQEINEDMKAVKARLVSKEKERRLFKAQCDEKDLIIKKQLIEIQELNVILGGSSQDLAQMKIDAKYANTIMVELNACKLKNKILKEEVNRLRISVGESTRSMDQLYKSYEGDDLAYKLGGVRDTLTAGGHDSDEEDGRKLERQREIVINLTAERDTLINLLSNHEEIVKSKNIELNQVQDNLNSTQQRLSQLLLARMGDKEGDDVAIQMAELNAERQQREIVQNNFMEEKNKRISLEEKLISVEHDNKSFRIQAEMDIKDAKQMIESLLETKTILSKEIEKLKQEIVDFRNKPSVTDSEPIHIRELESRLVQAFADTRKAHIIIQELKNVPTFYIRVFIIIRDFVSSDTESDNISAENVVTANSDQTSLQLKDINTNQSNKYIFDRVYTSLTYDKLLDGIDEYIKHTIDGKQTSLISYGETLSNKTELLFGKGIQSEGNNFILQIVLTRILNQLRQLQASEGWKYEVSVSFVRILEEDILDLFSDKNDEQTKKTHEIKRTSDGSTIVTNVNTIDINLKEDNEVQSLIRNTLSARHTFVQSSTYSSVEEWQSDCSQSHFVFSIMVKGTHDASGRVVDGKLNLVELAGDDIEILDKSGNNSVTANKSRRSLQCFSDIISAISKRQGHIPYRNTKITYVLQPSLSPNGKALVIFGLDYNQTYSNASKILQFATKVFHCAISPIIGQASGTSASSGVSSGPVTSIVKKTATSSSTSRSTSKEGKARVKIDSVGTSSLKR